MRREEERVHVEAYAFESGLDLKAMSERLNTHGPFRWGMGDSDTWGDYLITRPFGDRTKLRIVEEEDRFIFDIEFRSEALDAAEIWERLHAVVRQELLPVLLARNVRPTINLD